MNINQTLADIKKRPGFSDHVGMMLVHNGVVRNWSRNGGAKVASVTVKPDHERIASLCRELEKMPGIFCMEAQANEGTLYPGDDLLFLVVAGDIRENVQTAFSTLLNRIKAEAVSKTEHLQA